MTQKKKRQKLKIKTDGKSYQPKDSCLFGVKNKRKLSKLLFTDLPTLKSLTNDNFYTCFTDISGKKHREIEHPRFELDKVHTRIASLLCRIKQPNYIHSGIKGRSHITNAEQHIGDHKVLTADIKSFFPSTSKKMIFDYFFKRMQCSVDVANLLADLCTCKQHIPTGSRISMPLAFWANEPLFNLLYKISVKNNIKFTVYVDDIVFSGNSINATFIHNVEQVILDHGHIAHPTKTKLYQANEIKIVTGIALNKTELMVANKHRKNIFQDINQWKVMQKAGIQLKELNCRLLGRVISQSRIDPRLKDKARSIKISIKELQTHTNLP
jgi:hypothetical protein